MSNWPCCTSIVFFDRLNRSDSLLSTISECMRVVTHLFTHAPRFTTTAQPHPVAVPDQKIVCLYADGGAYFDAEEGTWHYIVQQLDEGGKGGWGMSHFSLHSPTPFGPWQPNALNPVVHGGQLWSKICAGVGKHCPGAMVDEGTPQIVTKVGC
jgi:hypothetical protein